MAYLLVPPKFILLFEAIVMKKNAIEKNLEKEAILMRSNSI
jgi:hypothetical protein